jgi:hypothetical protein
MPNPATSSGIRDNHKRGVGANYLRALQMHKNGSAKHDFLEKF